MTITVRDILEKFNVELDLSEFVLNIEVNDDYENFKLYTSPDDDPYVWTVENYNRIEEMEEDIKEAYPEYYFYSETEYALYELIICPNSVLGHVGVHRRRNRESRRSYSLIYDNIGILTSET